MKKWVLKSIVQKTISYLPFSHKINYLFQKYVTKGVNLSDDYFYDRLSHAKNHIAGYKKHSQNTALRTCLELGTGWYPVVPICFYLEGVETTYSVDISFLTSKERIKTTLDKFMEAHKAGRLSEFAEVNTERFEKLQTLYTNYANLSLEEILRRLHLTYLIGDARKLELADDTIDLVNSNNTFEHIYPVILTPILAEFKRVVNKEHGVMSHFIDMSDHFAHFDKTINIYNFLEFSDAKWKRIDNDIQPQSRLRYDDYKKMYQEVGVPITEETSRAGNLDELKTIKLAAKYQEKPLEIVAISHCHFVSKMV